MIVNTVANDLNLTKNPCSKAILQEGGSKMTTFCEKWIKDNGQLQEGNFAVTAGANLNCEKVFHVSCPNWTADQGEKVTAHFESGDDIEGIDGGSSYISGSVMTFTSCCVLYMAVVCWCDSSDVAVKTMVIVVNGDGNDEHHSPFMADGDYDADNGRFLILAMTVVCGG